MKDKVIKCTYCQMPCPFARDRLLHNTDQDRDFLCGVPILLRVFNPVMGYKREEVVVNLTKEGYSLANVLAH